MDNNNQQTTGSISPSSNSATNTNNNNNTITTTTIGEDAISLNSNISPSTSVPAAAPAAAHHSNISASSSGVPLNNSSAVVGIIPASNATPLSAAAAAGNGVLMIMPNGPNSFLPSLRKLRHLKSILCRNLLPVINRNAEISLPNTYYTLHAPPIQTPHRSFSKRQPIEKIISDDDDDDDEEEDDEVSNENNANYNEDDDYDDNNNEEQENDINVPQFNGDDHLDEYIDSDEENGSIGDYERGKSLNVVGDSDYNNDDDDNNNTNNNNNNNIDENDESGDNDLPPPFYISEVVPNSYNPVWNPFDCYQPISNDILDYHNTFNICIWHRSRCIQKTNNNNNNNNSNDKNQDEIIDSQVEYEDELLFQTEIDLTQLEFIAQEMKQFVNLILPPNSIIFELKDGLYVTKETKYQMRSTKANDYKFQSNSDKKKVTTGKQKYFLKIIGRRLQNLKNIQVSKETSMLIDDKLADNQKYIEKLKRLENLKHRVEQLKQEYHNQLTLQDKDKENIEIVKSQLVPKASALANAGIVYLQSYQMLIESKQMLEMEKLLLNNIRSSLEKKKWFLLSQIRSIYPIQQGNKVLNINGLPLPNSDFNGYDEENISTALGYVCHILHLASRYLDIPLRYPMTPMASRSFIKDEISHHSSSKFPLYSKGVEKRIFDYAVFLLNKNLEQLLGSQGLGMFSLKETLPNVQILLGRSRIV